MKNLLLLFFVVIICGCENHHTQQNSNITQPKLSKLEELKKHRTDVSLDYVDLSNENLTEMPNLSEYTIKSLNLSHNQINRFVWVFLPQGIEKIDISYNCLTGIPGYENINYPIKELNVAHNEIVYLRSYSPIRKLIASYNDMKELYIEADKMEYLDISHNLNFDNIVWFNAEKIDTVLYDFTLKNKPLMIKPIPVPPPIE